MGTEEPKPHEKGWNDTKIELLDEISAHASLFYQMLNDMLLKSDLLLCTWLEKFLILFFAVI